MPRVHRSSPAYAGALLVGALGLATATLHAQCPDGSPPPCGRPAAAPHAAALPTPDSNLVAILPFRVTTSDTLLGEGFAELLATQFTGEGSPRAVDMATVLSAWRHAGGGLRTPLPRARAIRLGRELGAGMVSEGSIVGLGSRVTVSASLVGVPGGETRGTAEPVSGPADSLDALLQRATTGLLASLGGQVRSGEPIRFTESPTAMRAYLEGLSAWRRGRLDAAAAAFDRAIADDSGFAQARFQRYLARNWGIAGNAPYDSMAWDRREGLSTRERAILETLLGTNFPAPRTLEARFEARQVLTERYPDSPDAWYFLGDLYFHFGRPLAPTRFLEIARTALERSAAIDSQATVLNHLVLAGILLQDTALLRRAWPALDRTDDGGRWVLGWLAAASTGDAAQLALLRRRPIEPAFIRSGFIAASAVIPPRLLDEMFDRYLAAVTEQHFRKLAEYFRGNAHAMMGRPTAAERAWAGSQALADEARVDLDLAGEGAGLDVEGSIRRLAAAGAGSGPATVRAACIAELWHRARGDSARADADTFRPSEPRCARALDAATLGFSRAPDADAALAAVDSSLHNASTATAQAEAFEGPVLARAWERRGNARRAAAAVRHTTQSDFGLRLEGRLSVLAGDTAAALHAYRRWLALTANADSVVAPMRDSVRAEVARLEGRQ